VRFGLAPLITISFFSFLTACTTPKPEMIAKAERAPTSTQDDEQQVLERWDATYRQIMSSDQPAQGLGDMVSRLVKTYFRATDLVKKFDAEMAQAAAANTGKTSDLDENSILKNETYSQIQASYFLMNRAQDKILYFYRRLGQDREQALRTSENLEASQDAIRFSKIRKEFHTVLKEKSEGAGAFALDGLFQKMFEERVTLMAQNHVGTRLKSASNKEPEVNILRSRILDSVERLRALHKKSQAEINAKIEEAAKDNEINEEIKQEASFIKRDFAFQFSKEAQDRSPAQAGKRIYPSAGAAGNVIGGVFAPGTWVLTFDDGPDPSYTIQLMRILEANKYPATFFWLGKNVTRDFAPAIIQHAKKNGHDLANHSQSHMNFAPVRAENMQAVIANEVIRPQNIMTKAYGYQPKFYRCPYGACNNIYPIRQAIADMGALHAFWAVDSLDWNKAANPNGPSDIAQRVKYQMASVGRGVILFHDVHPQTVVAVQALMPYFKGLQAQGHRVVSFCQAVDEANGDRPGKFCGKKKKGWKLFQ
jgi:peptidoglycan/xylan/chitin deacetylase (PgdA/CDA1 family)